MTANKEDTPRWHSLIKGTEAQIEALTSDKYLTVVSAGAGTGKTQTLAQRFAWLLASEPDCRVEEILVLTFTKKAAREMRDRIKKTLKSWYAEYPRELSHLKGAIEAIDDAPISTIHSFAMKMIRESGLSLDIDPTASIMPEPEAEIWWREFESMLSSLSEERIIAALPEGWQERAAALLREPETADMLNAFGAEAVAAAARVCAEKLYCAGQSAEQLWSHDDSELLASIASLKDLKKEIFELWQRDVFPAVLSTPDFQPGVKKKSSAFKDKLEPFLREWLGVRAASEEDYSRFCTELFEKVLSSSPSRGRIKDAVSDALGKNVTEWRNEMKELFPLASPPSEAEKRTNALLNRLCAVGWACWDEFRRRENLLSLSDLVSRASELLRSSSDYKKRFRHIMIDEFQDTDPLQDSLTGALWADPESEPDFHNTLFLVGDQKQSIYRFRHADLTLFRGYMERCRRPGAEKYSRYVSLDQNFRTASGLLEKFNALFGRLWGKGSDIFYEALLPPADDDMRLRRNRSVEEPQLELLCSVGKSARGKEAVNKEQLRMRLYAALGRKISSMREEGRLIWDKDKREFRAVRWRDFAVLTPTRSEYPAVEKAFERLGVPYILSTSKSYFARGETGDLVNLISLLAEPDEPLFLAGWLSSPFSGISGEEAEALIARALAAKEKRKALPLAAALRERRPDLWRRILSLRRRALLYGVSSVILEILKEPSFLESYAGLRRRRVNANIIHLARLAEEYERSQGISLKGCAEYLLSAAASQGATEEPDAVGDETDAIQVMTVHASKGLEFPVVALVYSQKGGVGGCPPIRVSKKYGVAAKETPEFLSGGETENGVAVLWEKKDEKRAEDAERERLWYVGFTRAQDKLILCSVFTESDEEEGKLGLLGLLIDNMKEENITRLTEDEEELPRRAEYRARKALPGLTLNVVHPARLGRISASAYALLSWCPAAYRIVYRQGRAASWMVKGGDGGGAAFGSLVHWLLARWDFRPESLDRLLPADSESEEWRSVSRLMPAVLRAEYASEANRARIAAMLRGRCGGGEFPLLAKLAAAGGALFRETPFRVPLNGTVLVGTTDLFWQDEKGLHLRDWKSAAEEFAPALYYEKQLEFYACALNIFRNGGAERNIPIDSALIYLRAEEGSGEIRGYSGEDFEAIAASIDEAAVTALADSFGERPQRCPVCPWRSACGKS
ncbi:MAG: UvrD-helicase domain-containing protein [Synergistaceae bacterium]|nr:UvrD-helicase domain-containing protein [Synergistaceae bacterium]